MRRRDFMTILAGAAAYPLLAGAQQKPMPVIGILAAAAPDNAAAQRNITAFREALAETGYVEGRNVAIEYRWAAADFDRLPGLAAELVARKVDLIVTEGGDDPVRAAKQATAEIPVVFHTDADPIKSGFVASLGRPGGNLTGVSLHGLSAKRVELLCELVPSAKAITIIVNPKASTADDEIRDAREAARAKGVQLHVLPVSNENEIEPAFARIKELRADALVAARSVVLSRRMPEVVALAARYAVPTIYPGRLYVEAGGLINYGENFPAMYRLKGIYAGKILNGAKPAELPVGQPAKFELAINLKTARALGLAVPQSLLACADEVIE
jgi:putative ABC transport system substrate-binding protein